MLISMQHKNLLIKTVKSVTSFIQLVNNASTQTPVDTTAPSLTTSSIDGQVITLTFDEPINTANIPSKDSFSSVNGES